MLRETEDGLCVDILVNPRSSRKKVGPVVGDRIKVSVTAPPVSGEANAQLVALFARALKIKKQDVSIIRGAGSRRKTLCLGGVKKDRFCAAFDIG